MNQIINQSVTEVIDCTTAPTTPGLLINVSSNGYRDAIVINQMIRKYSQTEILGACSIVI